MGKNGVIRLTMGLPSEQKSLQCNRASSEEASRDPGMLTPLPFHCAPPCCLACCAAARPWPTTTRGCSSALAVVSLMTFTVVPDITASNINIGSGTNQSSALNMTQIGGGATMSESVPIYLEGTLGFSRYDPSSWSATAARAAPFPLVEQPDSPPADRLGHRAARDSHGGNWVLRPIGNVTLGTVASDLRIGNWLLGQYTGKNLDFLDGGRLDVRPRRRHDAGLRAVFPGQTSTPSCATPYQHLCRALAAPPPV